MTKIEKVIRDIGNLFNFQNRLEKARKNKMEAGSLKYQSPEKPPETNHYKEK